VGWLAPSLPPPLGDLRSPKGEAGWPALPPLPGAPFSSPGRSCLWASKWFRGASVGIHGASGASFLWLARSLPPPPRQDLTLASFFLSFFSFFLSFFLWLVSLGCVGRFLVSVLTACKTRLPAQMCRQVTISALPGFRKCLVKYVI